MCSKWLYGKDAAVIGDRMDVVAMAVKQVSGVGKLLGRAQAATGAVSRVLPGV